MSATRRSMPLITVSAAIVGLLAGSMVGSAVAQETDLSSNPNVGAWMNVTTMGTALITFSSDGTVIAAPTVTRAGPQGVTFGSTRVGTWEATGERSAHLTIVQLLSNAEGEFTGTMTVDAYQTVSEDGQTFMSDDGTSITIRDAANNVVDVITGGPPAHGTRMAVGAPGFSEASPAAASPTP